MFMLTSALVCEGVKELLLICVIKYDCISDLNCGRGFQKHQIDF